MADSGKLRANQPLTSEGKRARAAVEFSGVVVCYNEAQRLRRCLESVGFCEELIVVDLGSSDDSVQVARECGAKVVSHRLVPIVEQVLEFAIAQATKDWVVRIDPDEVFSERLVPAVRDEIERNETLGLVEIPFQYYFRGKPLTTTIWGGVRYFGKIFHKDRVVLGPYIHSKPSVKPGFTVARIRAERDNIAEHYWGVQLAQLTEKHRRYIEWEGEARYAAGIRFSWSRLFDETIKALWSSLIRHRGIFGGSTGIYLSFFYAWYVMMANVSLLRYQKRRGTGIA